MRRISCGTKGAFEKCWAHSPLRAAARPNFTLPFTRCRYCRKPPAHRCPRQRRRRQQRQRVTEGTAMAPIEWAQLDNCAVYSSKIYTRALRTCVLADITLLTRRFGFRGSVNVCMPLLYTVGTAAASCRTTPMHPWRGTQKGTDTEMRKKKQ